MAERNLTYKQITDANALLDLSAEAYPDSIMGKVLWNRKAIEPHVSAWQRVCEQAVQQFAVVEGDSLVPVEEDEQAHPLENQFGVRLEDPGAADEHLSQKQQETVEVDLATITLDEARQIDTPGEEEMDEMQALDQWAFMLELE